MSAHGAVKANRTGCSLHAIAPTHPPTEHIIKKRFENNAIEESASKIFTYFQQKSHAPMLLSTMARISSKTRGSGAWRASAPWSITLTYSTCRSFPAALAGNDRMRHSAAGAQRQQRAAAVAAAATAGGASHPPAG